MRARVHECIQSNNRLTRGPSVRHVVNAVLEVPLFPVDEENECRLAFWLTMIEKWIRGTIVRVFFICSRIRFCLRMQFVDGETYPEFIHPFNITYVRFMLLQVSLSYPCLVSWLGAVNVL